ncbi:hypothetical protein XENTR_v10000124 [Xenopus tropicalis]|nr:hypothetical protein XENTR_v10000124 [Xenopus tropicalis]
MNNAHNFKWSQIFQWLLIRSCFEFLSAEILVSIDAKHSAFRIRRRGIRVINSLNLLQKGNIRRFQVLA